MGQLLLFIVVALVVAAIVFGVTVMMSGGDSGLTPVEPDGRAVPLPTDRPLGEDDVVRTQFDTAFRGYRMSQVDQALQRAAYDIGYKGELISVLEAEVAALRDGRVADADALRRAREAAIAPSATEPAPADGPIVEVGAIPPDDKPAATNAKESESVERR
jgi:DivIVA domain-containing protein